MKRLTPAEMLEELIYIYTVVEQSALTGISKSQINRIKAGADPLAPTYDAIVDVYEANKRRIARKVKSQEDIENG